MDRPTGSLLTAIFIQIVVPLTKKEHALARATGLSRRDAPR